jgi:hypothetical protein
MYGWLREAHCNGEKKPGAGPGKVVALGNHWRQFLHAIAVPGIRAISRTVSGKAPASSRVGTKMTTKKNPLTLR